jgi:hypothetical protein
MLYISTKINVVSASRVGGIQGNKKPGIICAAFRAVEVLNPHMCVTAACFALLPSHLGLAFCVQACDAELQNIPPCGMLTLCCEEGGSIFLARQH